MVNKFQNTRNILFLMNDSFYFASDWSKQVKKCFIIFCLFQAWKLWSFFGKSKMSLESAISGLKALSIPSELKCNFLVIFGNKNPQINIFRIF